MGFGEKMVGGSLKSAISKGQKSVQKYITEITEQQAEIIEKVNWMMITQQAICNKLGIKLKDPLEE